jgi:aldose 1-epimerase
MDGALRPFPPGQLTRLACGPLQVDIAADAGGRIARISREGMEWLVGYDDANAAMIAWGCYPMLPWAGRIRRGRFVFEGRPYQLPANLQGHAIHGVGFGLPWQIRERQSHCIELSLELPRDGRWPFGGVALQQVELTDDALRCRLSFQADDLAMPLPVLGWHPWFAKPEQLQFHPDAFYPRDAEGIAVPPPVAPPPGPWDDCFINHQPVLIHRQGLQPLGGLRPAGTRHMRGAADRSPGCVQPHARDSASARVDRRMVCDGVALGVSKPMSTTDGAGLA